MLNLNIVCCFIFFFLFGGNYIILLHFTKRWFHYRFSSQEIQYFVRCIYSSLTLWNKDVWKQSLFIYTRAGIIRIGDPQLLVENGRTVNFYVSNIGKSRPNEFRIQVKIKISNKKYKWKQFLNRLRPILFHIFYKKYWTNIIFSNWFDIYNPFTIDCLFILLFWWTFYFVKDLSRQSKILSTDTYTWLKDQLIDTSKL